MNNLGEIMIFKSKLKAMGFGVVKVTPKGVYGKRVKREIEFDKNGLNLTKRVVKRV